MNNDNDAYHNGYETTVTAFCFPLLTICRFPNRFLYTQGDRTSFSILRITFVGIISSSRNLLTLKLYTDFCPQIFLYVTCVILTSLKLISSI